MVSHASVSFIDQEVYSRIVDPCQRYLIYCLLCHNLVSYYSNSNGLYEALVTNGRLPPLAPTTAKKFSFIKR